MAENLDPISPATNIPPSATLSAAAIPDHDLIQRIGAGSYGEVWLARSRLGTFRAVKIVYERTFRHTRPFEREFNGVQKFEPISRLHEGLVDVLHVGREDAAGYFYCVMELADDVHSGQTIDPNNYSPRTLAHDLSRHKRLPAPECRRIGAAVASALDFLHRQGLIHRDIKPSNIIFVRGEPKLADIGLVADMSEAKSYVGTEGFIPPEGPGTVQADIYSLGKVLYEIITGKDRQEYPDLPTLFGEPAHQHELMGLNRIVLRSCQSDPVQRYKSAGDLAEDLERGDLQHPPKSRSVVRFGLAAAITGIAILTAYKMATSPSLPPRPPGLIAWWRGEDGRDSAGKATLDSLDGVGFAAGKVGQGFSFDGVAHRPLASNASALNFGAHQDFSIEAWIQSFPTETQLGLMPIVSKARCPRDAELLGYAFSLNHGRLAFSFCDTAERFSAVTLSAGPDLQDGQFHHVAASVHRDSKTGGILCVDGKVVLTFDPTIRSGSLSNAEPLRLGFHPDPQYQVFFRGIIDEVSLYNRALSLAEIQSIHRAGGAGKYDPNLNASTLLPPVDLASGGGPSEPTMADLDGDGGMDIVVAEPYRHALSVYQNLNHGGALGVDSFALPLMLPPGDSGPNHVVVEDLDGDGRPELIACEYHTNSIAVFRNVSRPGKLSFIGPIFLTANGRPMNVTVKDLDGDGRPEIASVNLSDTISIFRNDCQRGEIRPESFATRVDLVIGAPRYDPRIPRDPNDADALPEIPGAYPNGMVAGDLDGDGRVDLAIENFYGTNVSIFQNVGAPGKLDANTFRRGPDLPATEHNRCIAIGDVDGDGKPDLLVGSTNRLVSIYRNISRPGPLSVDSFAPRVEIEAIGWINSIILGDLNRDGKPDLIVYTQIADKLSVFQNLSTPGSFTAASLGPRLDFHTGNCPSAIDVADIDGDGWLDCVFANQYSGTISIRRNAGSSAAGDSSFPQWLAQRFQKTFK